MTATDSRISVLVIFGAAALYGMERGVIEIFDLLRPEVEPHFLISRTPRRLGLPIFGEIERRELPYSFLSDYKGWERLGKPRSLSQLWKMLFGLWRGNIDALREVRSHEILYIPNLMAALYASAAILYCRVAGKRVVYHFHDLLIRPSFILRLVSLFVTDFIHCSQLGFELVAERNPHIRKRRNHILPYRTGSPRRTGQSICVNGDLAGKVNLLFFGQVSRHKGVDILLEAFEKVAAEYPAASLHIAGGYSDSDFQNLCTEFMAKDNLKNRIKHWGYVEDIEQLLKLAYVHVHPSPPSRFMDTFPLAVLESMRQGVPTVCFKSGGLPEMIVDGTTGVVCADESVEGLAAGLSKILGDPQLRNLYSKQAAERYQKFYSEMPVKRAWRALFS